MVQNTSPDAMVAAGTGPLAIAYAPTVTRLPVAVRPYPQQQPCQDCAAWLSHIRPDLVTRPCSHDCHAPLPALPPLRHLVLLDLDGEPLDCVEAPQDELATLDGDAAEISGGLLSWGRLADGAACPCCGQQDHDPLDAIERIADGLDRLARGAA